MRCILLTTNRKPYEISHTPCQAKTLPEFLPASDEVEELFFSISRVQLTELFGGIAPRLPAELVEPVEKMISRESRQRPTAQLFVLVSIRNLLLLLHGFFSFSVIFFPFVALLSYKSEIMEQCRTTGVPRHSGVPQEISKVPRKKCGI